MGNLNHLFCVAFIEISHEKLNDIFVSLQKVVKNVRNLQLVKSNEIQLLGELSNPSKTLRF